MYLQTHEYNNIPPQEITDGMLIKLALTGEQHAFEILISRYQGPLFNFLCHFLGNSEMASDIMQNVFLKLYLSLPTLHTEKPLKAWLFQVARNCSLDELRRKHPIAFSQLEIAEEDDDISPVAILPDTHPLPEEIVEQHELQEQLHQAIDKLPAKFRQVVLLRYAGRLNFGEIGTILNMPQSTAKTYFQRAKPLLRQALAPVRGQYEKVLL